VQVHPTKSRAEEGYARENAAGLKADAAERNYRDANHKPELIVALTDFYALCGFRAPDEIARALEQTPELESLARGFVAEPGTLRQLYSHWMALPQRSVDRALDPFVRRVERARWDKPFARADWEYWMLRARDQYSHGGHQDRGLFSFLLMNLVHLRPGEGMYLPAGVLHSYLEGAGVELMANSNNVIRGGLTPKHVDVHELLRSIHFESGPPAVLRGQRASDAPELIYATPAREFQLSRIELNGETSYRCLEDHAVEIFIILEAPAQRLAVTSAKGSKRFGRGQVFLVAAGIPYELSSPGLAILFKATVPLAEPVSAQSAGGPEGAGFRGRKPAELAFGTSGLRGLVKDITNLEAYVNTRGFLDYLLETSAAVPGQTVFVGADLRPSSDGPGRSILRAVARAIVDTGLLVDNLGRIPTPALTYFALRRGRPSIMVTGSHIPFDRNGIKFNRPDGEVLKRDEPDILRAIARRRRIEYLRPPSESPFGDDGMFKAGQHQPLPDVNYAARGEYLRRYLDFFPSHALSGKRVLCYEHSAVGRDLLRELLTALGATVLPMGRSEQFVPVDTEALSEECRHALQHLADEAHARDWPIDAIVSTDGDSDRPLLAAVTEEGQVKFFTGDLLGLVAAEALAADLVVVPISANDAVDQWAAAKGVQVVKTKIGSPHVIQAMQEAGAGERRRIVGWEANGGFLTLGDIGEGDRALTSLPTRDAALPLVLALHAANRRRLSLLELFAELPRRFGHAGLIDQFPPESSRALLQRFSPASAEPAATRPAPQGLRRELEKFFRSEDGFGRIARINTLDGLRLFFDNGDIAHIRPSGNAPQLRVYAVADTAARAQAIVDIALREPDGILRRMEAVVSPSAPDAEFVERIRKNIAVCTELFARGETPEVIATVSGSPAARAFWQQILDRSCERFGASAALSLEEDLPTNQAFGLLLLWQRLKPQLRADRGALAAFVFGEGTRSTPFTETDNGQKPAMATFVAAGEEAHPRFLSMVELALRHFVPVQQFLHRSGFDGLVVKWGDEVQIPTLDLSGANPLFRDADIVRFVSMREMNADEAKNKDWVGVDERSRITGFIPRRPLEEMEALVPRGLLQRRAGQLWGGVNLGSIAVSRVLLDCLLDEFRGEINDRHARREERPALDPEFFTAITIAAMEDLRASAEAWERAGAESSEVRALAQRMPDLLPRLGRALHALEHRQGRRLRMVAMDFGEQYWGDIGQHSKIHEFYMGLNQDGPLGDVARAIAGLPLQRDAQGNYMVQSSVAPGVRVRHSVLIHAHLSGHGVVEHSVLVGTRARNIWATQGFDVLSTVADLHLEPRSGTYKVVAGLPVHARPGERLTTLFLPSMGPQIFRVLETTNLKARAANYDTPILGNPLSFQQAHLEMGALEMGVLEARRLAAERAVLESNP
jgi:phosphomannomutase